MSKQRALRVGDYVRLIDPRPILLLGYEQTIDTLEEEVGEDPEVMRWCRDMKLNGRARDRVIRAVAGNRLDNLVGERKLVRGEPDEVFYIYGRVVRKTGVPVPERYTPGGYYDEPDWESGYLANEKTHVCYRLEEVGVWWPQLTLREAGDRRWPPEGEFWVTREQVERADDEGERRAE